MRLSEPTGCHECIQPLLLRNPLHSRRPGRGSMTAQMTALVAFRPDQARCWTHMCTDAGTVGRPTIDENRECVQGSLEPDSRLK
ncbi:unnamed protein product [Protopolystoma xenopodis]|uniref:Uncharacterized protein n=1 Tax=Protopolystoma xenopodis TaxID=117903 RepID=A0A3S5B7A0_9PLAT|nr:unnamed protein product [Protopolystoma xenopodis]